MRKSGLTGAIFVLALLSACEGPKSPAQQAAEDARAVAMVEAAQNVKPPPVPVEPQPITAADIEQNHLYGSGCTFVPAEQPGGNPLVMADANRAVVKLAGKFVTFAADPGSAALARGARVHYVGKAQSLDLVRAAAAPVPLGREGLRWDGRVMLRDATAQVIWSGAGVLTCGA